MHDFAIKTSFCLKFIVWKLLLAMLYKLKYSGMKNVCTSGKYAQLSQKPKPMQRFLIFFLKKNPKKIDWFKCFDGGYPVAYIFIGIYKTSKNCTFLKLC